MCTKCQLEQFVKNEGVNAEFEMVRWFAVVVETGSAVWENGSTLTASHPPSSFRATGISKRASGYKYKMPSSDTFYPRWGLMKKGNR